MGRMKRLLKCWREEKYGRKEESSPANLIVNGHKDTGLNAAGLNPRMQIT